MLLSGQAALVLVQGGGCVGTWLTRDLLSMVWTSGIKVDQAFLNVALFAYEILVF